MTNLDRGTPNYLIWLVWGGIAIKIEDIEERGF
jgi:hypothetical protein